MLSINQNNFMLQIAYIRDNQQKVIAALSKKNFDATSLVPEVVLIDENRRATQVEMDTVLAEANKL